MLIFGEKLLDIPVLSLQTGTELARTDQAIINPADLQIIAYSLTGKLLVDKTQTSFVRTKEIREYSQLGVIIDSTDEIIVEEDIISQKDVYSLGFDPVGMSVLDENNNRIGKVSGYTISTPTFTILQLRVAKTGFARLTSTDVLIHRSQILEINNTSIVVKATTTKLKDVTPLINTEPIINPFRTRKPTTQEASSFNSDSTS